MRLEDDVCDTMNRLAGQERRTVSALLNEALREFLGRLEEQFHPEASLWRLLPDLTFDGASRYAEIL